MGNNVQKCPGCRGKLQPSSFFKGVLVCEDCYEIWKPNATGRLVVWYPEPAAWK